MRFLHQLTSSFLIRNKPARIFNNSPYHNAAITWHPTTHMLTSIFHSWTSLSPQGPHHEIKRSRCEWAWTQTRGDARWERREILLYEWMSDCLKKAFCAATDISLHSCTYVRALWSQYPYAADIKFHCSPVISSPIAFLPSSFPPFFSFSFRSFRCGAWMSHVSEAPDDFLWYATF